MTNDKLDARLESLLNTCWAEMMDILPDIRRIADAKEGGLDNINDRDKRLIIGVFCLLSAVLLKKQVETEKLEGP